MSRVLVVSAAETWPLEWTLAPHLTRYAAALTELDPEVECIIVAAGDGREATREADATLRAAENARRDAAVALLLAARHDGEGVGALLCAHDVDGFLDLAWPQSVAAAVLDLALRQAQLGRNLVDIQQVILEQSRRETSSLYQQAAHDDLTGLYNRRAFTELLAREHERCQRHGRPYALIFIDVDDLKGLNSRHGHAGGSQALRELALVLRSHLRASDFAGRIGGDEFGAFLGDCDAAGAMLLAERLRRRVADHTVLVDGRRMTTSISVGVASYPRHGGVENDVLGRADQALFTAKARGKNCAVMAGS